MGGNKHNLLIFCFFKYNTHGAEERKHNMKEGNREVVGRRGRLEIEFIIMINVTRTYQNCFISFSYTEWKQSKEKENNCPVHRDLVCSNDIRIIVRYKEANQRGINKKRREKILHYLCF